MNDQVQKLSRWPNDTMALMGEVVETGSIPRNGEMDNRGGTFRYFGDRPSQWKSGDPKWIAGYFAWGYADDMVRIAQIDTTDKTIKLDEAVMYGLISGADYNRWYVVNLLEEVDVPGEYYIDYPNMTLWLYPSEKIEKLSLSLLAEPMLALEGVKMSRCSISTSSARGAWVSIWSVPRMSYCAVAVSIISVRQPFVSAKGSNLTTSMPIPARRTFRFHG